MGDYPELADGTPPAVLPCASFNPEVVARVQTTLQRICPEEFFVQNVMALRSTNKPYCQWYAEFQTANYLYLPTTEEELKAISKKLMQYKPLNSKFVSRHLVSAYAIAIVYSRDPCPCTDGLDYDKKCSTVEGLNECEDDIGSLFEKVRL